MLSRVAGVKRERQTPAPSPEDGAVLADEAESREFQALLFGHDPIRHVLSLARCLKGERKRGAACDPKRARSNRGSADLILSVWQAGPQQPPVVLSDVEDVTFDAKTDLAGELPTLMCWARDATTRTDLTDAEIGSVFRMIKRGGGVTVEATTTLRERGWGGGDADLRTCTTSDVLCAAAEHPTARCLKYLLPEPEFRDEWSRHSHAYYGHTPLIRMLRHENQGGASRDDQDAVAVQLVDVTNDEAINYVSVHGETALCLAVFKFLPRTLRALLSRYLLVLDTETLSSAPVPDWPDGSYGVVPSESVRFAMRFLASEQRQTVATIFGEATSLFSNTPRLIMDAVHAESTGILLPLPLCDIIFAYVRMPLPVQGLLAPGESSFPAKFDEVATGLPETQ